MNHEKKSLQKLLSSLQPLFAV